MSPRMASNSTLRCRFLASILRARAAYLGRLSMTRRALPMTTRSMLPGGTTLTEAVTPTQFLIC